MNGIRQLKSSSSMALEQFAYENISKSVHILQGIDTDDTPHRFKMGYKYYAYAENGTVESAFSISPNGMMNLVGLNSDMYQRMDFFRILKDKGVCSIKIDEQSALACMQFLKRMKISFSQEDLILMKFPIDEASRLGFLDVQNKIADLEFISDFENLSKNVEFLLQSEKHFTKGMSLSRDLCEQVIKRIENNEFLVLKRGEKAVSQGAIEYKGNNMAVIGNIYTANGQRSKGYGTVVTVELANRLVHENRVPFLFVQRKNEKAINLYEKIGFKKVRNYKILQINKGSKEKK